MPFIDIAERKGMEKGLENGLLKGLEISLKHKFGPEGLELMPELRDLQDPELLEAVLEAVPTASSLAELRRVWSRGHRPKKGRRTS